jgi:hypothetical protein
MVRYEPKVPCARLRREELYVAGEIGERAGWVTPTLPAAGPRGCARSCSRRREPGAGRDDRACSTGRGPDVRTCSSVWSAGSRVAPCVRRRPWRISNCPLCATETLHSARTVTRRWRADTESPPATASLTPCTTWRSSSSRSRCATSPESADAVSVRRPLLLVALSPGLSVAR